MKLSLRPLSVPLRRPLTAAHGTVSSRLLVVVRLEDPPSGLAGHGEAAPLPSYDGVSVEQVADALADCRPALREADAATVADPRGRAALLAECERRAVLPQALAAIDLALWDLAGRATGQPVWRLLGAEHPATVTVNWTVAAVDRAGAAREAAAAREAGFSAVKLKVATGDDAGRVAAVRAAAGPGMAIRLDANGGWSSEGEALRWLQVLAPSRLECCEEPVHGASSIERLQARVSVPLALDESASDPTALERRCASFLCLKISRCGGITGVLRDCERARRLGYQVWIASTYDGPLGVAAALHAASAIAPERACGLATLGLFERHDPLPARAGAMKAPSGPGLGAGLAAWYDG